jgi:uncharacterized protein (DUF58 family)
MKLGRFRIKTTKEGRRSALALLLVAFAALNTGNNLIYLIVAMMTSVLAISVIALWVNLKGLKITVAAKTLRVFAGEFSSVGVMLENCKKRLPSYSLRLISPRGAPVCFSHLPAGASERTTISIYFPKRGLLHAVENIFEIESGFPFIFFSVSTPVSASGEILVYPRLVRVDLPEGGLEKGPSFCAASLRGGPGEELHSLREYTWGDDFRRINWKATARHDILIIREHLPEDRKAALLVLDGTGPENPAAFEKAVSIAAGLANTFLERGYFLSLATHDGGKNGHNNIPFGEGQEHLCRVLDCLALIKEGPRDADGMPHEGNALVLKGRGSRMASRAANFRTVIYADRI